MSRRILCFLCTNRQACDPDVHKKRYYTAPRRRQEKSRAALGRGGYRQARLGNEIIILCNAWIKPLNMQQMGVFFAEGMCFDTSMEGNGGPAGGVPHYAKGRVRCPRDPGPQMVGDGQDRAHALG